MAKVPEHWKTGGIAGRGRYVDHLADGSAMSFNVDLVALSHRRGKLVVATLMRLNEPYRDLRALPGGGRDVTADDTCEPALDALAREGFEETGLRIRTEDAVALDQKNEPGRDPRTFSTASGVELISDPFVIYVAPTGGEPPALVPLEGETDLTEWTPIDEIDALAFDHFEIVRNGLQFARDGRVPGMPALDERELDEVKRFEALDQHYALMSGEQAQDVQAPALPTYIEPLRSARQVQVDREGTDRSGQEHAPEASTPSRTRPRARRASLELAGGSLSTSNSASAARGDASPSLLARHAGDSDPATVDDLSEQGEEVVPIADHEVGGLEMPGDVGAGRQIGL